MPSEKKKHRRSISVFVRRLFSRSGSTAGNEADKKKRSTKKKGSGKKVDFGIEETEKLPHFVRVKPPRNRRPPGHKPASSPGPRDAADREARDASGGSSSTVRSSPAGSGPGSPFKVSLSMLKSRETLHSTCSQPPPAALALALADERQGQLQQQQQQQQQQNRAMSKSVPNLLGDSLGSSTSSSEHEEGDGDEALLDSHDPGITDGEASPEDEVDTDVETRCRARKPRTLRSESLGIEHLHLKGSSYSSYQELIRATHKSLPNAEVVLS